MDKKKQQKNDVTNYENLRSYLIDQAESSQRLFHYTTFEALLSIIEGKTLRLSRLDLLNDKAEQKIGQHNDIIKSYIISFTKKKEYVSMWAMYGKSSGIKIRLDFSTSAFLKSIDKFYYDSEKTKLVTFNKSKKLFDLPDKPFDPIQLSDVAYLDKDKMKIRHNSGVINGLDVDEKLIDKMTGFIKYDAWEFEKETRLRVQLNKTVTNTEESLPNYIYCAISDELIKSIHITFNPWMTPLLKKEIKKSLNSLCGFDVPCDDSADDGEITEI